MIFVKFSPISTLLKCTVQSTAVSYCHKRYTLSLGVIFAHIILLVEKAWSDVVRC